jgi:hypothetical protein
MEEFDIQTNWTRPSDHFPTSGTRCIVTDGDVIIIATYISDTAGHNIWIFSGLADNDSKTFDVQGWMPLPKQIKKVVTYETPVAEAKRVD